MGVRRSWLRAAFITVVISIGGATWIAARAQAPAQDGNAPAGASAGASASGAAHPSYNPSNIDVASRTPWGGYSYSPYLDAEVADSDVHRVLYEDDHVRLLEVTNPPGLDAHMHGHPFPSVFVRDS